MKIISKIIYALSFSLFCFGSLFGQEPAFEVNLNEVSISEKRKLKTFTIGCYKHSSLKTNQFSFNNYDEIAVFLKKDSLNYLIQEVYAKLSFEENDFLPVIILRLRKVLPNNEPGEILYQRRIEVKKNILVANINDQNIYLPKEGIFISLSIEEKASNTKTKFEMTTRHKESFTYTRLNNGKWKKTQAFHFKTSPMFSTHPWNGLVGLKLREN